MSYEFDLHLTSDLDNMAKNVIFTKKVLSLTNYTGFLCDLLICCGYGRCFELVLLNGVKGQRRSKFQNYFKWKKITKSTCWAWTDAQKCLR